MESHFPLVLVTGATSPAGRRWVAALAASSAPAPGWRIRCLALPGENHASLRALSDRVQILVGDLRSATDCARLCHGAAGAVLFHLAIARDRLRLGELRQMNVAGTTHLLAAAAKAGVKRIVALSDAVGEAPGTTPFQAMLRAREAALLAAAPPLESVVLRSAPVYGPDWEGTLPAWAAQAIAARWPAGKSLPTVRLTALANVVEALRLAATVAAIQPRTFTVADVATHEATAIANTLRERVKTEFPSLKPASHGPFAVSPALAGLLGLASPAAEATVALRSAASIDLNPAHEQLGYRGNADTAAELRLMLQAALDAQTREADRRARVAARVVPPAAAA